MFPTRSAELGTRVSAALAEPASELEAYFGAEYEARIAQAFEIEGRVSSLWMARVAAAVAVIDFAQLPEELVATHLRRDPEELVSSGSSFTMG